MTHGRCLLAHLRQTRGLQAALRILLTTSTQLLIATILLDAPRRYIKQYRRSDTNSARLPLRR